MAKLSSQKLTGEVTGSGSSPLTTKGDIYGFSTSDARLPVGSNTQVLTADSAETLGVKWATPGSGSSPLTTKGDLHVYTTVDARLAVGTNSYVLTADSGEASGVKWAVAPGASSTAWTTVILATTASTTSITAVDTALAFTPGASKRYEIEAKLVLQTTNQGHGAQPGVKWPTAGIDDGCATIRVPANDTSTIWKHITAGTDNAPNNTSLIGADVGTMSIVDAMLFTNGSISGDFIITIETETGAETAKIMAGSILKYREIV